MIEKAATIWDGIRENRPLVQCITNYVTVNDVANILLAAGASPAMCDHPDDAGSFAKMAGAVYLNVGTLSESQERAMLAAAAGAGENCRPLLLDPVGCGVISTNNRVSRAVLATGAVRVIKGNQAEIKSLAGFEARAVGVDSVDSGENLLEACQVLHNRHGAVIAATGAVDFLLGGGCLKIKNGTPLFQDITGAGCMLGGIISACLAVAPEDVWTASLAGILAFNIAGERAARSAGSNPGSFKMHLMDKLYNLRGKDMIVDHKMNS